MSGRELKNYDVQATPGQVPVQEISSSSIHIGKMKHDERASAATHKDLTPVRNWREEETQRDLPAVAATTVEKIRGTLIKQKIPYAGQTLVDEPKPRSLTDDTHKSIESARLSASKSKPVTDDSGVFLGLTLGGLMVISLILMTLAWNFI